jgi:transposase
MKGGVHVIKEKEVIEIRILKEMGLTNKAISKYLGYSRKTISKYLKGDWIKMKRDSKLSPFKEYILKRLKEYPELKATVIYKEIKDMGYMGKMTILRDFIRGIRPRDKKEIVRFETEPGKQFQVDWGSGKTSIAGEEESVKYFVMVLGYSRMIYVEFVRDERLSTLLRCHNDAFEYFGGYCNEGLYDNMKTVVKRLEKKKEYNAKFMEFAEFYGFEVKTHRPYNPKAKGKVERMVPFVRNNLLYGKKYSSFEELNRLRFQWLEDANNRLHSDLKERPIERFEREKKSLNPLKRLYPIRMLEQRKVKMNGGVVYKNRLYNVGMEYAGEMVNLEEKNGLIRIYSGSMELKEYPLNVSVQRRSLVEYETFVK